MRICVDLDNTICEQKRQNEEYSDLKPKENCVEILKKLKAKNHHIIIYTSRHMKTCNYNIGRVIAKIGKKTLQWLDDHNIPYDEIWFGKPLADLYIDDKSVKFNSWAEIDKIIENG